MILLKQLFNFAIFNFIMEPGDKQKHILETAEALFAQKGYDATTVRDIADAAQVNLAMISYYFGSKEKMLEQLFEYRMTVAKLRIIDLLNDKKLSPFEKVEGFLEDYIKKVTTKQSFYKLMLCEQVMQKNPVVIQLIRNLKLEYANLFGELLKEGQRKKLFAKDIDVVMAISTMTGTVTQMIINKEVYTEINNLGKQKDVAYTEIISGKLKSHLSKVFKSILGYEG
ncbi:MAG: TetR/AcrR family transcriptional regulator [Ferruginibacter sp.]